MLFSRIVRNSEKEINDKFSGIDLIEVGRFCRNNAQWMDKNMEQPSASYKLLLNNITIVDTLSGKLTLNMSILCGNGKIIEIALIISQLGIRSGTLFRSTDFLLRTTGSHLRSTPV